jgi:hypothetical protein
LAAFRICEVFVNKNEKEPILGKEGEFSDGDLLNSGRRYSKVKRGQGHLLRHGPA